MPAGWQFERGCAIAEVGTVEVFGEFERLANVARAARELGDLVFQPFALRDGFKMIEIDANPGSDQRGHQADDEHDE